MATIEDVISNGVCVGCGGCGVATSGRIPIKLTTRGVFQADVSAASDEDKELGSRVCPFANESKNEDQIASQVFPGLEKDVRTGHYLNKYAGRINDDIEIPNHSSGGLTTWLLSELLNRGEVDGVIHVGSTDSPMFNYVVSHSVDDLNDRRKSRYYPTTFGEALRSVRGDGKRYAFVGVPCAVRSARLVAEEDTKLGSQILFYVGIVCGHLKSTAYAESFAWQLGVKPEDLEAVDFRIKDPQLTSRQYSFGAKGKGDKSWREAQTLSLVGGSWGHAVFQLEACNYCDDVFAETADVVLGDAWLSKYEVDWRGTNVVITRNQVIDDIFQGGRDSKAITLDSLDLDSVARTQAGNFRHRREGLAVRLADDMAAKRWSPIKRVKPRYDHVTSERVELIRKRREISANSHEMFAAAKAVDDLDVYLNGIKPLIDSYQKVTKMSFSVRVRNKLQREFWKVLKRVQR